MISQSEQIRMQYEFAMAIGNSLDLHKMLRTSLITLLRKMNCHAGGVYFFNKNPAENYQLKKIITIPRNTSRVKPYQEILNQIPSQLSSRQLTAFYSSLPISSLTDNGNCYICELSGLGVVVLCKSTTIDPLIIKSLEPIFTKLAVACQACRQNEELLLHKTNLQEMVDKKTGELTGKNQQLTEEIEHRKNSEQALRTSEEKYRELVENANSIILRWDTQGRITFFNEYAQSFFGFSEDEIIGRHVVGTIVPESESTGRDLGPIMEDICNNPQKYEYNINENMRKNGARVWVAWTNKVLTDNQGNLLGALSIGADITEHRKSEQRFKLAAEAISDLIYEWDIKDNSLSWFGDIDGALGYEAGEFPHTMEAWMERIHPEDIARLSDAVALHQTSTDPINYGYKIQRKDGSWIYWSDYGVPVLGNDGKPRQWIGACTNITEKKRVEEELIESEERYRALFTNEVDAISIFEIQTKKIVDVNDAWLKLYGYQRDELNSMTVEDVSAERESTQKAIKQSAKTGTVFIPERYHKKKDGTVFIVELSAGPFTWKGQQLMYALVRDITERKLAENDLQRAKEAAESANKAKSAFLANMSHELRTPLNAILGFSELLTRDPLLSPEQLSSLETISRSGEHLLSLINDVLEFSKIEAGRANLHIENFDLHHLLLEINEMFRLRARQKKLYLDFEQDDRVPQRICADQNKLRQVLINLLGNAVKFTDEGGITLRVTCKGQEEKNLELVLFEVIDTGRGITREEHEKVFEAFFQTGKLQPAHQGTGLGLPISQKFVSLMGGCLLLNSEDKSGTKFSFSIPVERVAISDAALSQQDCRVIGLDANQPPFRLMVVEDDENSCTLLVKLLKSVGFTVKAAKNGKEAVALWKKWRPHLIWMDMRMPIMDGYEATRIIKSLPGGDTTIIVALTASAFEEDRRKVIENGGNDFVRKPFRENEIFEMLSKHLGIKFVYETKKDYKKKKLQMSEQEIKQAICELPKELKNDFKTTIDKVDFDKAVVLIEKIQRRNKTLANALKESVNGYQFDILQNLFEEVE